MALQQGDTLEAKRYIARASNVQPDHPAVRVFEQLFRQLDSLRELSDDKLRSQQYLLISKTYGSIGIVEAAIDNALLALKENPNSIEALSALAEMYRVKRRYAPALRMLRMMTTLDPHNTLLDKQFEEVSTHF
jgi:tetratricopeptide (TPR) repeat protein